MLLILEYKNINIVEEGHKMYKFLSTFFIFQMSTTSF